ncbi:MAG: hypothetical protein LBV23_00940 [Deltaproteobacteria bacterium]|jgi:hypothetical protein|nr:hypothetical protein [Deltaproteobacteria bacterium]
MVKPGYDISRIEGEITATLRAADPYGLVEASVLAMGSLLKSNQDSAYWEARCLAFAGSSRNDLLARFWVELLYNLRHDQINVVTATVVEFSESKLVVECFFSTEFTPGALLLGLEWLKGSISVPVFAELEEGWVASVVWKSAV